MVIDKDKNKDNFLQFKQNTEENEELIKCFEEFKDFNSACNAWLEIFNRILRKSIKKI